MYTRSGLIYVAAGLGLVCTFASFLHGWKGMGIHFGFYYAIATLVTLALVTYVFVKPQQQQSEKQLIVIAFSIVVFVTLASHGKYAELYHSSIGKYMNQYVAKDEINALNVIINSDGRFTSHNAKVEAGTVKRIVVSSDVEFTLGEKQSLVTKLQRIYPDIAMSDIEWKSKRNGFKVINIEDFPMLEDMPPNIDYRFLETNDEPNDFVDE